MCYKGKKGDDNWIIKSFTWNDDENSAKMWNEFQRDVFELDRDVRTVDHIVEQIVMNFLQASQMIVIEMKIANKSIAMI